MQFWMPKFKYQGCSLQELLAAVARHIKICIFITHEVAHGLNFMFQYFYIAR